MQRGLIYDRERALGRVSPRMPKGDKPSPASARDDQEKYRILPDAIQDQTFFMIDPRGQLDISERKAMEAKYRGLLEAVPDAMVVVTQGGEIVLSNPQAEKQFGYRRDELLGQKVKKIIPEGFAERQVAESLRSSEDALEQQIGTGIELTARRKDGSEFPIEIMLSPLESSEGILVTAAIRLMRERSIPMFLARSNRARFESSKVKTGPIFMLAR
jgi:PAS domain S-box-containing protein